MERWKEFITKLVKLISKEPHRHLKPINVIGHKSVHSWTSTLFWAKAHDAQLQVTIDSIEVYLGHKRSTGVAGAGVLFVVTSANLVLGDCHSKVFTAVTCIITL